MKNYPYPGGCYPPRLKPEVDNIPRDPHYSSHRTKAEFRIVFLLRIAVNAILNDGCLKSNIPSSRLYIADIFQIWQALFGYEELPGGNGPKKAQSANNVHLELTFTFFTRKVKTVIVIDVGLSFIPFAK